MLKKTKKLALNFKIFKFFLIPTVLFLNPFFNHIQDAKEYLIDYFYTKVSEEDCKPWSIGRK